MRRIVTKLALRLVAAVACFGSGVYFFAQSLKMDGYLLPLGECSAHWQNYPEPPGPQVERCAFNTFPWQAFAALLLFTIAVTLTIAIVREIHWRSLVARAVAAVRVPAAPSTRRFVMTSAGRSARRMLAIGIAVVSITGTVYFAGQRLNTHNISLIQSQICQRAADERYRPANVPGQRFGPMPPQLLNRIREAELHPSTCVLPSRYAWQIPLAVLLGLIGMGAAFLISGQSRPRRRLSDPINGFGGFARI